MGSIQRKQTAIPVVKAVGEGWSVSRAVKPAEETRAEKLAGPDLK
jgi:hypothetical protein